MVYLNGKIVKSDEVDPSKHKFIGMFRPARPLPDGSCGVYLCDCGHHLWSIEGVYEHWLAGHMDIPQYVDIKERKEKANGN